jgi:hypothetical protein
MSFEQLSYLAQIVAPVGVFVSLIFFGLRIKQNAGMRLLTVIGAGSQTISLQHTNE